MFHFEHGERGSPRPTDVSSTSAVQLLAQIPDQFAKARDILLEDAPPGLVALADLHFWLAQRLIAPNITPAARPQAALIQIDLLTLSGLRRVFWRAWWRQSVF